MVFSSVIFLFLFLPVVLTIYFAWPTLRLRNLWLLATSIVFYAWGEISFVPLMVGSTLVNFGLGRWLGRTARSRSRKWLVALSVIFNLGILVFFKYSDFLIQNLNWILKRFDLPTLPMPVITLPLGISFFTFHAISYIMDIYQGKSPPARRPTDVALYIFLFPQLIAGPILRWGTMASQIARRSVTLDGFSEGVRRFLYGLAKKVLIANTLAVPASQVFAMPPEGLSFAIAWIGVLGYTLQIYFDFSGYSDMAIGLGRMFGFEFMENFNYPYVADSVRDFWHRWHISLSTWFRDYLYFPLGGNQRSAARTHVNLLIVFFLCGLWHGANWTFVLWGLYHGFFLGIERTRFGRWLRIVPRVGRSLYTLVMVIVGWTIFRSDTLAQAGSLLRAMAGFAASPGPGQVTEAIDALEILLSRGTGPEGHGTLVSLLLSRQVVWAGVLGVIFSMPIGSWARRELTRLPSQKLGCGVRWLGAVAEPVWLAILFVICSAFIAENTYNPFIYFRF